VLAPVYISHLPGEPGDGLTDWVSCPAELVAVRLTNAGKLCVILSESIDCPDADLAPLQMSSQTVAASPTGSKRRLRLKVQISGYDHRRT
jgi:hypothetical protein